MTPRDPRLTEPEPSDLRSVVGRVIGVIESRMEMQTGGDYLPGAYFAHQWWKRVLAGVVLDLREALTTDTSQDARMRSRIADVHAAVREAYYADGERLWWNRWIAADNAKRVEMETLILGPWSGGRS